MRYFVVAVALSACFLGSSPGVSAQDRNQPPAGQRKSEHKTKVDLRYDRKKDVTTVRLDELKLWENPTGFEQVVITFSFDYPKRVIAIPKTVLFIVRTAVEEGPLFDYQRDLVVTADGSRLNLGEMNGGDKRNRSLTPQRSEIYFERLTLAIPYEDFATIARARSVTVQLGERSYNLSDKQLQSLSDFLEMMQAEGREFR